MTEIRGLALQAFDGSNIVNEIGADPTPQAIELTRSSIDRMMLRSATSVSRPSGRYNCHGLVFASRRTNIYPLCFADVQHHCIDVLLQRDGYVLVEPPPRVGDVAVYRFVSGEIEHTGIVCRIDAISRDRGIVFVWSKWGSLEEFVHKAYPDCTPYKDTRLEYWRLEP